MERDEPLIAAPREERSLLDADKRVAGVSRRRMVQKRAKNIAFTRAALA